MDKITEIMYTQDDNGNYIPHSIGVFDSLFDFKYLPIGIWHVTTNGVTNINKLLDEKDINSKPLISSRINIKELIIDYLVNDKNINKSITEIANDLTKLIVPSSEDKTNLEIKGVRLRKKRKQQEN